MSYSIAYQGPFIKRMFGSSHTAGRTSENPLFGEAFSATVSTPNRRIYLMIQNVGGTDVDITFTGGGSVPLKLFAGTTITFDNCNFGFTASAEVKVFEAFA
jgi:hypothetical protein